MDWIDTHTHIYQPDFDSDREEVIKKGIEVGVVGHLLPNIDTATISRVFDVTRQFPERCYPMLGLHPCSVKEDYLKELDTLQRFIHDPTSPSVVGIGEIGMDLYWDKTFQTEQEDALRIQFNWAKETDLPVSVHTREAMGEVLRIIEDEQDGRLKGVLHCFTGTIEEARKAISLGFYLGIGGVVTYKKSELPGVIEKMGLERIVLETDAPFLPPTPHRGKRNEAEFLFIIGKYIAGILTLEISEVAMITTKNAREVFKKLS